MSTRQGSGGSLAAAAAKLILAGVVVTVAAVSTARPARAQCADCSEKCQQQKNFLNGLKALGDAVQKAEATRPRS